MKTFIPFGSSKNLKEREQRAYKVFVITFVIGLALMAAFIKFVLNQAK